MYDSCEIADYELALVLLRDVNRKIGSGDVLAPAEHEALAILGRVAQYVYLRIERGPEVFQRELREAGKSTRAYDGGPNVL